MKERFWCDACEQVGIAGDHECTPQGGEEAWKEPETPQTPKLFLGWLREDYAANGPRTFRGIEEAWERYRGSYCPTELLEKALGRLLDVGEVTVTTGPGPLLWRPTGMERARAERMVQQGLQTHLDAAVKRATERLWGKVRL